MEEKPPVTMALIALQVCLFAVREIKLARTAPDIIKSLLGSIKPRLSTSYACLQPTKVLAGHRYRLVYSSFIHLNQLHLLHNMLSLLHKAPLEASLGSYTFLSSVVFLSFTSHAIYTALAVFAARHGITRWSRSCVAGFSGVLFGLSTIQHGLSVLRREVTRGEMWQRTLQPVVVQLVIAQILVPRASFAGHCCGILSGLIYLSAYASARPLRSHQD